ncbi:DUF3631 domain-containing protein [Hypericibacter sp.]|uniref:DUF3631 domain-containing protein n=1 Tax=Hypericibacter sp. TaxID=2705401 RepID=UPI003D6D3058
MSDGPGVDDDQPPARDEGMTAPGDQIERENVLLERAWQSGGGASLVAAMREIQQEHNDPEAIEARLQELAKLPAFEYDRRRDGAAHELGIRVSTLDKLVERQRPEQTEAADEDPFGWAVEPSSNPQNGASLLDDLVAEFSARVILPQHGAAAMALWVLHSWLIEAAYHTPFLAFSSPEPRCGKSSALAAVAGFCSRPLTASNITAAAVFRTIERWSPSLIIDEADSFVRDNEELRGILNSGHSRPTAFVIRLVGEEHEPTRFTTWCPKAIALIGSLPTTLHDRAIVVPMRRKLPGEKVAKRSLSDGDRQKVLRARVARWAADNAIRARNLTPVLPDGLNDRAADNWSSLIAIADLASGAWPGRARAAAMGLSAGDSEAASVKAMLLADIRSTFEAKRVEKVTSAELVAALVEMEGRPWPDWKGKPMSAPQLARALAPFSIAPSTIRTALKTQKGYHRRQFDDAFSRYLQAPPSEAVTEAQAAGPLGCDGLESVTTGGDVTDWEPSQPAESLGRDDVTDQIPLTQEEGDDRWET